MKKKVWIINHYAGNMLFDKGGRHYWFAKYLKRVGCEPVVFCANSKHGAVELFFDTDELYTVHNAEDIDAPFVFVKARTYIGNGKQRILNMIDFYRNVKKTAMKYAETEGKPDVILASSVHPLTCVAGIKLAKKFGVKCICEIRDLWPLTLVEYGKLKKDGLITKLLYKGEKWIYKNADAILFTFKNGKQYIIDQKWEKQINLDKIYYINNGIDLELVKKNKEKYTVQDSDLEGDDFKIIYAGAMGPPNGVDKIIDAAQKIKNKGKNKVKFILYGDGILRAEMEARCKEFKLDNVVFKGKVSKEKIPFILSKADAVIIPVVEKELYKYGLSTNKMFDYISSGKPIITNSNIVKSITEEESCLIVNENMAEGIIELIDADFDELSRIKKSSDKLIKKFDFKALTDKLILIIE